MISTVRGYRPAASAKRSFRGVVARHRGVQEHVTGDRASVDLLHTAGGLQQQLLPQQQWYQTKEPPIRCTGLQFSDDEASVGALKLHLEDKLCRQRDGMISTARRR